MINKSAYWIFFLIFMVFFAVTACSNDDSYDASSEMEEFEKKMISWQEQDISNYSFAQKYFSGSTGPLPEITVEISGNRLEEAFISESVETLETKFAENENLNIENLFHYKSITDVYQSVLKLYKEQKIKLEAGEIKSITVDIRYDEKLPIPTYINFSVGYNEDLIGGIYFTLEISDLKVN